jgi:hypothetical protein
MRKEIQAESLSSLCWTTRNSVQLGEAAIAVVDLRQ